MNLSRKCRGLLAIAGGICFHCVMGCVYIWGAIALYVTSYLFLECDDKSASSHLLMLFHPLRSTLMLFFLPLGAYMDRTWGPTIIMKLAFFVWISCFISLIWVKTTTSYILLMGVGFGVPTGLGYVPAITVSWKYFPELKSRLSGIITCAYGGGAAILTYVATYLVNPEDKGVNKNMKNERDEALFEKEVYSKVPDMWIILNLIWGILLVFSIFTIRNPKGWKEQEIDASEDLDHADISISYSISTQISKDTKPTLEAEQYTDCNSNIEIPDADEEEIGLFEDTDDLNIYRENPLHEHACPDVYMGLKSMNFWIMVFMLTMGNLLDAFFSLAYKSMGVRYGYGDVFLSVVGIIYSVFNGLARLFWGYFFENRTFKLLIIIITVGMCFFTGTLPWLGPLSQVCYLMWIDFNVIFIAATYPIYPVASARYFGAKLGPQIYGFMGALSFTTSSILCFLGSYYLVAYISYDWFLWICALLNLPSLLMICQVFDHNPKWTLSRKDALNKFFS